MMRPMKLAGAELLFGEGTLEYLEKIKAKKAVLVLAGEFLYSTGIMDIVDKHLKMLVLNMKLL